MQLKRENPIYRKKYKEKKEVFLKESLRDQVLKVKELNLINHQNPK